MEGVNMNNSATMIPLIIVLVYIGVLMAISVIISKKQKKDGEAFLLYKGKNNAIITAVTVAGLAIGGASTIGIAENAVSDGMSAGWYNVAWASGALAAAYFVISKFRKSGFNTIAKMLEVIYDKKAAFIIIIAQVIMQCAIISLQYKAGGAILASLLPDVFDANMGIFFSFIMFMLISLIGGMGSASISNILNIALIYFGVIVTTGIVLFTNNPNVGMNGLQAAIEFNSQNPQNFFSPFEGREGVVIFSILALIITMTANCTSLQGVVQIGLTSKSDEDAKTGFKLAAIIMIPIGFLCALLGICAKAIYPDLEPATRALPVIILSLSPFIAGITLAGLWAADMSTACSMLIGCSTTVSQDILAKTKLKDIIEKNSLLWNKLIILGVGVITYVLAMQKGQIITTIKTALSLSIPVSIVVLGGIWFKNYVSKKSAFYTVLSGILMVLIWVALPVKSYFSQMPVLNVIFADLAYSMFIVTFAVFFVSNVIFKEKVSEIQETCC
ncbi:sodium:solute symporter family protein [Clostridium sp.]|uniref:sodium:solute symporter family protein n=1 Tax=Clostridium sp. TaxID=1506 RepID=UPI002915A2F9|nr:sodium:solute symporter family protein [Clostridium sp.]MDU6540403.1 sodium:solute symporter family protein [Clostridium sp.]